MKKYLLFIALALCLCCFIFFSTNQQKPDMEKSDLQPIYLNAYDDVAYAKLEKLYRALKAQGQSAVLCDKKHPRTGAFNIYATSDFKKLPPVADENAINFLWLPSVEQKNPEPLRPYDVVVTETMPSFYYMKAINIRTAYIPKAVDINVGQSNPSLDYPMYYGDNDLELALALYLAGPTDLKVDVFGKGFEKHWTANEIMKRPVSVEDFQKYALVLTDQSEDSVRNELLFQRVIDVIERGGLPYIRFNNGVAKMFGDVIPMYHNEDEFLPEIKRLLAHPKEIKERKTMLREIAKSWDSESQAKKFIELFDVMNKKRR